MYFMTNLELRLQPKLLFGFGVVFLSGFVLSCLLSRASPDDIHRVLLEVPTYLQVPSVFFGHWGSAVQGSLIPPNVQSISDEAAEREEFCLSAIFWEFMLTALLGTLILQSSRAFNASRSSSSFPLRNGYAKVSSDFVPQETQARWWFPVLPVASLFVVYYTCCVGILVYLGQLGYFDEIQSLPWEVYHLMFLAACASSTVQAALVFAHKGRKGNVYPIKAFLVGLFHMVCPYVSDPFDTLKDATLGALCIYVPGAPVWLQVIGYALLAWLFGVHVLYFLEPDIALEMSSAYLGVYMTDAEIDVETKAPEPTSVVSQRSIQFWIMLYAQTTTTRVKMILWEDFVQVVGGLAFLIWSRKVRIAIVCFNVGLPIARVVVAEFLRKPVQNIVEPWLVRQVAVYNRSDNILKSQALVRRLNDGSLDIGSFLHHGPDVVQELLVAGVPYSNKFFEFATNSRSANLMLWVLTNCPDFPINASFSDGDTALHYAAYHTFGDRSADIAVRLLQAKANIKALNGRNQTPIAVAKELGGREDVLTVLEDYMK